MGRRLVALLLAVGLLVSGCGETGYSLDEQRERLAVQYFEEGREVTVGVVWNAQEGNFFEGATLAAEEVNAEGGIKGRPLRLVFHDEEPYLRRARVEFSHQGSHRNAVQDAAARLARSLVREHPSMAAVIGHSDASLTTLPAMLTYHQHGLLFLGASATDPLVTHLDDYLAFQMLPPFTVLARQLAAQVRASGWRSMYLIYEQGLHGEQFAEFLGKAMTDYGVSITGETAFVGGEAGLTDSAGRQLYRTLANLRGRRVDAIILLTHARTAAQIVSEGRRLGVAQPFVGTTTFDSPAFLDRVGAAGEGALVTSILDSQSYLARRFAEDFAARYPGRTADSWAALGYDSVRLFADAVACAGSPDPTVVATTLRYNMPPWYGVTGTYSFDEEGANLHKDYFFRILRRRNDGDGLWLEPVAQAE